MKRWLSAHIALCLIVVPEAVLAFGRLEIYADPALSHCSLSDNSSRLVNIYVAESTPYGATGLRFRIAESPGFTGIWLNETSPFATVGNSRTDLSIGFGICEVGQFTVLNMQYQLFGTSACSTLSIAPANGISEPICTGCVFSELPCIGYMSLHVNCDGSFDCNPVATEVSTWGSVKALYRD